MHHNIIFANCITASTYVVNIIFFIPRLIFSAKMALLVINFYDCSILRIFMYTRKQKLAINTSKNLLFLRTFLSQNNLELFLNYTPYKQCMVYRSITCFFSRFFRCINDLCFMNILGWEVLKKWKFIWSNTLMVSSVSM